MTGLSGSGDLNWFVDLQGKSDEHSTQDNVFFFRNKSNNGNALGLVLQIY